MSAKHDVMPEASYPFTADEHANRLLAQDGTALLIGLCLEQQVRSEKAMIGPYLLRQRLGTLDAAKIAAMSPARLTAAFEQKPTIHRFPNMMAKRVQALCRIIAEDYRDDGARVWAHVESAAELYDRFRELPGFGDGKAACGVRLLAKHGGKATEGWESYASDEDLPWLFKDGKKIET